MKRKTKEQLLFKNSYTLYQSIKKASLYRRTSGCKILCYKQADMLSVTFIEGFNWKIWWFLKTNLIRGCVITDTVHISWLNLYRQGLVGSGCHLVIKCRKKKHKCKSSLGYVWLLIFYNQKKNIHKNQTCVFKSWREIEATKII